MRHAVELRESLQIRRNVFEVDAAMADGFSTAQGLGLGLGGARRLADEFEVTSTPGARTPS